MVAYSLRMPLFFITVSKHILLLATSTRTYVVIHYGSLINNIAVRISLCIEREWLIPTLTEGKKKY